MNRTRANRQKMRRIMAQAHRLRGEGGPQPSQAWRLGVLNSLPGPGAGPARPDQWAVMGRLVWRLAPAAGALTLLLALLLGQPAAEPPASVATALSADTVDYGLYAYYQSEARQ